MRVNEDALLIILASILTFHVTFWSFKQPDIQTFDPFFQIFAHFSLTVTAQLVTGLQTGIMTAVRSDLLFTRQLRTTQICCHSNSQVMSVWPLFIQEKPVASEPTGESIGGFSGGWVHRKKTKWKKSVCEITSSWDDEPYVSQTRQYCRAPFTHAQKPWNFLHELNMSAGVFISTSPWIFPSDSLQANQTLKLSE